MTSNGGGEVEAKAIANLHARATETGRIATCYSGRRCLLISMCCCCWLLLLLFLLLFLSVVSVVFLFVPAVSRLRRPVWLASLARAAALSVLAAKGQQHTSSRTMGTLERGQGTREHTHTQKQTREGAHAQAHRRSASRQQQQQQ